MFSIFLNPYPTAPFRMTGAAIDKNQSEHLHIDHLRIIQVHQNMNVTVRDILVTSTKKLTENFRKNSS